MAVVNRTNALARTSLLPPSLIRTCPTQLPSNDQHKHDRRGQSGVMLAYLFTFNPHATSLGCPEMFVRSFKATRSKQSELVLLYELPAHAKRESFLAPCHGEQLDGVRAIALPDDVLARLKATGLEPFAYRLGAFLWFLSLPDNAHEFAGVLDADIFFQVDVFDAIFSSRSLRNRGALHARMESELHFFAEDASVVHRSTAPVGVQKSRSRKPHDITRRCDCGLALRLVGSAIGQLPGPASGCSWPEGAKPQPSPDDFRLLGSERLSTCCKHFKSAYAGTSELNLGHIFGTRIALVALLEQLSEVSRNAGLHCWDQGILNLMAWTASAPARALHIWGHDEGPVKTLEQGGLRDARGRFVNELGLPYAIVHQIKPGRNGHIMEQLGRMLPALNSSSGQSPSSPWQDLLFANAVQRVPAEDRAYAGGVHPSALAYSLPASSRIKEGRPPLRGHDPSDPRSPLSTRLQRVHAAHAAGDVPCGLVNLLDGSWDAFLDHGVDDGGPGRAGWYRPLASWTADGALHGRLWHALNQSGWVMRVA